MTRTTVTVFGLVLALTSVPAAAADKDDSLPPSTLPVSAQIVRPRPPAVPSLYVSLAALQVYDGYSTSRGLRNGAVESNAILGALANHPTALWAAKGGSALASIYVSERLWRGHHRGQAIALMIVSNGMMAAVAASNASIIRSQR